MRSILEDAFERLWDNNQLLWEQRTREKLESCRVKGHTIGCGNCPDKYTCGGCQARSYSYFKEFSWGRYRLC